MNLKTIYQIRYQFVYNENRVKQINNSITVWKNGVVYLKISTWPENTMFITSILKHKLFSLAYLKNIIRLHFDNKTVIFSMHSRYKFQHSCWAKIGKILSSFDANV